MPTLPILTVLTCLACVTASMAGPTDDAGEILEDRWDVAYVASDKIGYFHSQTRKIDAAGKPVIHTRQSSELAIQRFGQEMRMQAVTDYYELSDGRLYATDAVSRISNEQSTSHGRLQPGGKFKINLDSKGSKIEQTLDWPTGVLGPYAQEQSLRAKPLEPGQTRSFVTFLPEMNVVATRTLKGIAVEATKMSDGQSLDLLLALETSDKVAIETSLWLDQKGNVLKSLLPIADLQLTVFRGTKELALGKSKPASVDLGYQTLVKPDKPATSAHTSRAVTYLLELGDETASKAIPEASYQKILSRDGNNLLVKIQRAIPNESEPGKSPPPGPEFLESNGYIQPDNPAILATAREVTKGAKTAWEKATRLEKWVDENMSNQDFSIGFAPSSEIIETRQGDCTEHAVLLAALCRAAGIPSRVAMGLVWLDGSNSFGYHMWTEIFVAGDWYPIDGTLGYGAIGGGHIKIADGSLKGVDANSAFLPIFKVIGKLKIKVKQIDPS